MRRRIARMKAISARGAPHFDIAATDRIVVTGTSPAGTPVHHKGKKGRGGGGGLPLPPMPPSTSGGGGSSGGSSSGGTSSGGRRS